MNRTFMRAGALLTLLLSISVQAEIRRAGFNTGNQHLIIEALDDDLIHFEYSTGNVNPDPTVAVATSPMVLKTDYTGPKTFRAAGNVLETTEIRVEIDPQTLCVSLQELARKRALSSICPADLGQDWKGLNLTKGEIRNVYGLGQQFKQLGSADGDWVAHKVREEQPAGQAQSHGNGFMPFGQAGMVGNVQYPVMYALGDDNLNYALFLDNVYKQRWDFAGDPWQVRMWGDQIRFYVMTGPDLPDLRRDYLELVGTPPVPPRKAFGLWVSEFGYRTWSQVDSLLSGLRRDSFPIDGFVLDLQWFGGIVKDNPDSQMGKLDWDRERFPDPDTHIAAYRADHVGLVTIEESYVNLNTDTLAGMRTAGNLLAYQRTNGRCDPANQQPVVLTDWFGKAAMIDWSNPASGAWIHASKRFPNMAAKGIAGHWTDLGEPEKYDPNACYRGVETTSSGPKNQHGDIHNLYAFLWNKSIYDGYVEKNSQLARRPFIVTRSGASGSQRFGVAAWSGDIGSNLDLLASHLNAQMHMSFSGIDYYGSDIGGFRREGMPYNGQRPDGSHAGNLQYQNELFTQWFANGAWFDVPVRPHTDNSFQTSIRYDTAPDLVGDMRANRENIRQRYELAPYYYSLAYCAHLFGEPVIPPLVHYYQNDPEVRSIGHEKLIGRDLLVGIVAKHGEYVRDIYLPRGRWINYHTREQFISQGEWIRQFPVYVDGVLRLPAFARAGAILPQMPVDEQTKDAFGHRQDGTSRNELVVQIYPDATPSAFTLYEDDGESIRFTADQRARYDTRTTAITQQKTGDQVTVTIDKASGKYAGAPTSRNNVVKLISDNASAIGVRLNGISLKKYVSQSSFNAASKGWHNAGQNLILIKTGSLSVGTSKKLVITLQAEPASASLNLVCDDAWTAPGETVHAVGSEPALGAWDTTKAVALSPSVYYEYIYNPPPNHNGPGPSSPKWTGMVVGLQPGAVLEWKCAIKTLAGQWRYMPGSNRTVTLSKPGYNGTSIGSFRE